MRVALELIFWISLLVILYSYALYPVILTIVAHFFGKPVQTDERCRPTVGVLIPVYNEEDVIRRKLENICALDYPPEKLSIWVGSDCCTDRTEAIVESYNDPRIHLWVAPDRGGKTGIVNRLAPQVDAEIILLTDANTMHRPDSLNAIVRNFADSRVGGVAGHIEHMMASGDDEYAETFYRVFESTQKSLESRLHSTISAFGGFYAIRKELFRLIPKNAYSNDDVLIPMQIVRQKYRMVYEREAVSEEDFTEDLHTEFSRRVRIGAGNFQAFFWLIDFLNPVLGWPFFCYVSHKVTRWFSPLFLIAAALSCGALFWSSGNVLYRMLFVAGMVFTCAGMLSNLIPLRITRHIFYFLAMNFALALGFIRFLAGIRSASWSRTERSAG